VVKGEFVIMKLSNLRPASLDAWAGGRTGLSAGAWKLLRASLLDRAVYWGLALTLVLPAVLGLFGIGFAFTGGLVDALLLSGGFFVYALLTSVIGGVSTILVLGKGKKSTRCVQQALFVGWTFAFLLFGGFVFSTLAVSVIGAGVGAVAIALLGEWSVPAGGCSDGQCEVPKK
jgi:hypothetical protein